MYPFFCEICNMENVAEKVSELNTLKSNLVSTIHFLHEKGWAPATSSNYSLREAQADHFWVSQSGVDKGDFAKAHFMKVDLLGNPIEDARKPSAETLLHVLIYERYPETGCILHTHTVYNTVLSIAKGKKGRLKLAGYEVLKGLQGISTHDIKIQIPIFKNSQDIAALSKEIGAWIDKNGPILGFLLEGHGFYTWAKDIASAKRQMEVFEFLFEVEYKLQLLK